MVLTMTDKCRREVWLEFSETMTESKIEQREFGFSAENPTSVLSSPSFIENYDKLFHLGEKKAGHLKEAVVL